MTNPMHEGPGPNIVAHILGFVRGALVFGGTPVSIRGAVEREFPRLTPAEVDEVMAGGLTYTRPQAQTKPTKRPGVRYPASSYCTPLFKE